MRIVTKLLLFLPLLIAACVMAGLYGMAHDQLSYSISPDYFHHLKFDQFMINSNLHNRAGAALVGFLATWWMGLLVGPPLMLVGLMIPMPSAYAKTTIRSFAVSIVTAAVVGLIGLAIAIPVDVRGLMPGFEFPDGVTNQEAFLEVGVMHTASYLGGLLGLLAALIYLIYQSVRQRQAVARTNRQAAG